MVPILFVCVMVTKMRSANDCTMRSVCTPLMVAAVCLVTKGDGVSRWAAVALSAFAAASISSMLGIPGTDIDSIKEVTSSEPSSTVMAMGGSNEPDAGGAGTSLAILFTRGDEFRDRLLTEGPARTHK